MKTNILKACYAGFMATTVITLMVYFVSPGLTGGPSDLAALIATVLGVSWIAGLSAHFVVGTLVLPMVYAVFLNGWLSGGPAVRGMTWGLLLWLTSQAIIIPLTGGGFFSSNVGGLRAVMDSLIGQLIYGLVLGVLTGTPRPGPVAIRHDFEPEPHVPNAR
jgi:uncharacterized membrane protein (DUF485 family)